VSGFSGKYELELYHANDVKELYTCHSNFMALHVECPFNLHAWDFKGKEVTETVPDTSDGCFKIKYIIGCMKVYGNIVEASPFPCFSPLFLLPFC